MFYKYLITLSYIKLIISNDNNITDSSLVAGFLDADPALVRATENGIFEEASSEGWCGKYL